MDKQLLIEPYTIVGATSGKEAFSRVFVYQPEDEELRATHGELYVVLSATIPGVETDWEQVATELFNQLKDRYYAEAAGGIQHNLEDALNACREAFEHTVQQLAIGAADLGTELHLGALVMWGGGFVYHSLGKVYFALVRNSELVDMTEDRFVQEAVQSGDAFVLGTSVFGQRIDTVLVQHILQSNLNEDWQTALRDEIKDVEAGALLSGVVLNVRTTEVPDQEDVIELKMSTDPSKEKQFKHVSPSPDASKVASVLPRLQDMFGAGLSAIVNMIPHVHGTAELYVEQETKPRSRKKWLVVAGFVLLLLGSIFVTYQLNQRKDRVALQEETAAELIAGLQRVEELQQYDQVQAKRAFDLIQKQMGQVQGVSDSLQGQFQQTYNTLYAVQAGSWVSFEIASGSNTRITAADNGSMIAVDADTGSIRILHADGTYEDRGQANEFAGISYIVPGPDGVYGYHANTGLWFYSFSSQSIEQIMTQSGRWGNARGMDFYEDNVYIFAPDVQDLVKYLGLGGGRLSGGTGYFVDPLDYASVIDIAIDGHVFTLSENNFVEKFLGGRRVEFTLHGVYPTGQVYRSIVTGVGYDNVYIATDTEILVFSTDGEYRNSIAGLGSSIRSFTVNSDESLIVVVTDTGLLRTSL